ncbi:MAG: hypothetical protein R3C05_29725 [Pirellulaceae bacterium]
MTEGYSASRAGIALGGILMLFGYSSIAEELPSKQTQAQTD